jgi:cell division protein FtsB
MSNESIITIISGVLQTGAISFVVYMIIKGLKLKVINLQETIDIQYKTIEAMDKRIIETEKISDLYKQFIEDYPKALESYKATIVQTKDDIIFELNKRVETQKGEIKELQEKVVKLNPEERSKFEKITGLLLTSDFKQFHEFIQKIEEQKDKVVYNIIKSNNMDEFMSLNGYKIVIDNQIRMDIILQEDKPDNKIRSASFSVTGMFYAFTFKNDLILNDRSKLLLEKYYNDLKK